MRRFLSISFIVLALVVGAAGAAPAAHAATTTPAASVADSTDGTKNPLPYDAASTDAAYNGIMIRIMGLFAWLVGVAAITLDNTVYYTVVRMGDYVNQLSAVGVAWRIIRDLSNILLIFGFLGAGITTILNVDLYGWSKNMLPKLLIVAVFINFSLFISEAMIDGTNLVATQFYTQINGGNPAGAKNLDSISAVVNASDDGIASKIMGQLGLQTIYGDAITNTDVFKGGNTWFIGFMGILLFIVVAFVMFSLAFILIARFVVLIFLILVSPLAVIGWGVPWLKFRFDQWWEKFIQQIITAPVLLLLLYVALAVITDANFLTGFCLPAPGSGNVACTPNWTGFASGNLTGFASMILSFLVAIGLLLVVVIKAKSMSAIGAAGATKLAGMATFGATAWAGRRTIGRASNFAARKIRSSSFGASETGRLLAGIADRGAKGSFDMRGTKVMGNLKPYTDLGAPQKGGYKGREEELIKARTEYAKSLGQSTGQKAAIAVEEEAHKKKMKPIEDEEKKLVDETKAVIKEEREKLKTKKKELEAAHKFGNTDQIRATETEYNNALRAFEIVKEEQNEILEPIRMKIKDEKDRYGEFVKSNSKEANQQKYAKALQSGPIMKVMRGVAYDWPTAVGSARREAAGKIMGELKKDPTTKAMEALKDAVEKADKKVNSGNEEKKSDSAEKKPA